MTSLPRLVSYGKQDAKGLTELDGLGKAARMQFVSNYIGDLRSQIGLYIGYIPNEYADQPSADNFYTTIEMDKEIARCSHLLSLMAAGERIKIKHDNKILTRLVSNAFREINDFLHARKSLIEKSVVFGLGIQKKHYETVEWEDFPGMRWQVCTEMKEVDRRRLRIERDTNARNKQYWTIWQPQFDAYQVIEDRAENPNAPLALQDYAFLYHTTEELYPYFRGFGDVLYDLAAIKTNCMTYWGNLAESWSQPFLTIFANLMKGSFNASSGTGFPTENERKNAILEESKKWRARHVAIFGDSSEKLEWNEHGNSGSNIIRELVEYCDKKIQLIFCGTELSTGAGGGQGSYALGAVHKQEFDTIIQYNRSRLCEVLAVDIAYDFLLRNRWNLYELGIRLPRPRDVEIAITVDAEEQQQQQAQGDKQGGMRWPSQQQNQ